MIKKTVLLAACILAVSGCITLEDNGIDSNGKTESTLKKTSQKIFWGRVFSLVYEKESLSRWKYEYEVGRLNIKVIQNLTIAEMEDYILNEFSLFQTLYKRKKVAYAGQHTRVIECPEEFSPKFREKAVKDGLIRYYTGYANSNYVFGICTKDLITYKAIYGFLKCPKKGYTIEFKNYVDIKSNSDPTRIINDLQCIKMSDV